MGDYNSRKQILERIEAERGSRAILYVTGDRNGLQTQISPEAVDLFVDHLDAMWPAKKISLVLYTCGGDTAAAWRLINLLRTFCEELEVIVPSKALSAGTLLSLGANRILMTKQATLGPIDPSLHNPMNPQIPGTQQRAPVSVEAVQGYLDVIRSELGFLAGWRKAAILQQLGEKIHPLVLGQIFRSRTQIRNLARELLKHQEISKRHQDKIISFLCSESGSHDHTINRREAKALGLRIDKPSEEFYETLRELYKDFATELQLSVPFRPDTELKGAQTKAYDLIRALIESPALGAHHFKSKGTLQMVQVPGPNGVQHQGLEDTRTFEAWEKVA